MKLPKISNPKVLVNVNITEYLIDWDHVVSKPQKKVKDFLRKYWSGHVVCEELRIPGSLYRIDIINFTRRIVVEVSPSGSHSFNKFFHQNRFRFGASLERERKKAEWIESAGCKFVEIFEDDMDQLSSEWFKSKYAIEL